MQLVVDVDFVGGRIVGAVRRPPSPTAHPFSGHLELVACLERLHEQNERTTMSDAPDARPLGSIVEIDDRTLLVTGQDLDIAHDQPDVGNALVHRTGDRLVIVDTGVTSAFREALRAACDRVGPWSRALLLTTHGHTDHVGNNDLVDELGVPAEHWVPAGDVAQMRDPVGYWEQAFTPLTGVAPLPAPPALSAAKVVSLFAPLRPFGATTRTYEERPPERLWLGPVRMSGWTFADGAVQVLRSQGHCAGHVVVHLRDAGLVHLGDEANGACGAMRDADQLKLTTVFGAVASAVADGAVTTVTEGHSDLVRRGPDALAHLDSLLDQGVALHGAALEITAGRAEVRPGPFVEAIGRRATEIGASGPNPNPVFTGMVGLNILADLGLEPGHDGGDGAWSRPPRTDPEPVSGTPHGLALLPAAVSMAGWKLRGRDR